jgi:hypothetical protein
MSPATASKTQTKVEAAVAVNTGLCVNCNHAPSCVFLSAGGPAWYCEEFDGEQAAADRPAAAHQVRVAVDVRSLCGNCENNAACRFPVAATGALHCEEYR